MKKILAIILALVMVLGLAACGTPAPANNAAPENNAAPADNNTNTQPSASAEWPKEIKVLIPATAGSPVDSAARLMMKYLGEKTGSTFVPENDATGNGLHALETLRTAKNDGSTLMFLGVATCILPATHVYDYMLTDEANFTICGPMIGQANTGSVWLTQADAPYDTIEDMVKYIKDHPGEVVMGKSSGNLQEVKIKMFCNKFGLDDSNVRFVQSSNDELTTGLLNGSINVGVQGEALAAQLIAEGKIKGLANNSLVRAYQSNGEEITKILDEIPNYKDLGLEDIAMDAPMFVLGPAGMDPALQQMISDTINTYADDASYMDQAVALGRNSTFIRWDLQDLIKELKRCDEFIYDVYNK